MTHSPARTCIVHNKSHCLIALRAAHASGQPVRLMGAADSVRYQGPGWLLNCARSAAVEVAEADWSLVVDCGDAPGLALAAAEAGVTAVIVRDLSDDARRRLEEMLLALGSTLVKPPQGDLDLLSQENPETACHALFNAPRATSH